MAAFDIKRLAARMAGRPAVPKYTVVAGTTINTNIAVSGLNREDMIVAVLEFQDTAGATQGLVADRIAETSITSSGNIQLTTTNTTGHGLLVIWYQVRR